MNGSVNSQFMDVGIDFDDLQSIAVGGVLSDLIPLPVMQATNI